MGDMQLLFNKYDFQKVMANHSAQLAEAVDALPDTELFREDIDALIAGLLAQHLIVVPTLDPDRIETSLREVELHGRAGAKSTEVSFRVPYAGDKDLFLCQPSTFSLNPPRAEISTEALTVRVSRQDQNAAEYRREFDRTFLQIQDALTRLRNDSAGQPEQFRTMATTRINQRREKRRSDRSLLDGLGFSKAKDGRA